MPTKKEVGVATGKGAIDAIPFVGGLINRYIDLHENEETKRIRQEFDNRLSNYEHALEELKNQIYEQLNLIPPENIVMPSFSLICAAIEAAKYQIDDANLRGMFAHLIGNSMNCERTNLTHPAFVEIIKQLTPDEAKILNFMPIKQDFKAGEPIIDICYEKENRDGIFIYFSNISVIGFEAGCEYPQNVPTYINNLCRLGIFEISNEELADTWRYEKIENSPFYMELKSQIKNCIPRKRMFRLTDLGIAFCCVCLPLKKID